MAEHTECSTLIKSLGLSDTTTFLEVNRMPGRIICLERVAYLNLAMAKPHF